jgi:UDP-2,3-diacylglucosamine pyrophosphatase LpxH
MAGSAVGIGDLHFPWADKNAVKAAIAYIRYIKPRYVIQVGDCFDFYSSTRFARSLNVLTPEEEHKRARAQAEEFWEAVRSAAGRKATLIALKGNHDDRPIKRILEQAPELEHIVREGLRGFWDFPGVKTVNDSTEELIIDDVLYTHGFMKFGEHFKKTLMSTVCGHLHKGEITTMRIRNAKTGRYHTIFEANCGFLGDPFALPLRYRQLKNTFPYTKGLLEIDAWGPRFISLENP